MCSSSRSTYSASTVYVIRWSNLGKLINFADVALLSCRIDVEDTQKARLPTSARSARSASPTYGVAPSASRLVTCFTCCMAYRQRVSSERQSMILMLNSKSLWATTFYRYRPRWTESWVSSLHQAEWKGGRLWGMTPTSMVRIGSWMMGPLPVTMSKGMFMPVRGVRMSENRMTPSG